MAEMDLDNNGFDYQSVKDMIKKSDEIAEKCSEQAEVVSKRAKVTQIEIQRLEAEKELAEAEKRTQEELDKIEKQIAEQKEKLNKEKQQAQKIKSTIQTQKMVANSLQEGINTRIESLKEQDPDISMFISEQLKRGYESQLSQVKKEENQYNKDCEKVKKAKDVMKNPQVQQILTEIMNAEKQIEALEKERRAQQTPEQNGKTKAIDDKIKAIKGRISDLKQNLQNQLGNSVSTKDLMDIVTGAAEYKKSDKGLEVEVRSGKKGKNVQKLEVETQKIDFQKTLDNIKEPVATKNFKEEKAVFGRLIKEEMTKLESLKQAVNKKQIQKEELKTIDTNRGKSRRVGIFGILANWRNRNKAKNEPEATKNEPEKEEKKQPTYEEKRKQFAKSMMVKDYIAREAEIREKATREAARKAAAKRKQPKQKQNGR